MSLKNELYSHVQGHGDQKLDLSYLRTHVEQGNMWFLKLTKLNRGRGIYVFDSMKQLISLLNE